MALSRRLDDTAATRRLDTNGSHAPTFDYRSRIRGSRSHRNDFRSKGEQKRPDRTRQGRTTAVSMDVDVLRAEASPASRHRHELNGRWNWLAGRSACPKPRHRVCRGPAVHERGGEAEVHMRNLRCPNCCGCCGSMPRRSPETRLRVIYVLVQFAGTCRNVGL